MSVIFHSRRFQNALRSNNSAGYSIPLANCSASTTSSTAPFERRFDDQLQGPHFNAQFFLDFYQSVQTLGQQCQSTIGSDYAAGPYMNSAVVARDIISFLDAYANSNYSQGVVSPQLLNFWGFSYGVGYFPPPLF